jgi:hypothetical protein
MDLINLSVGSAGGIAVLGYVCVFIGMLLLMAVVAIFIRIMIASQKRKAAALAAAAPAPEAKAAPAIPAQTAPGSAGDLKLYDTDPRDAAMIMAIVADKLGRPLNELRFKSIREVKK